MDANDRIDPKLTADRMAAEIGRVGSAVQECLTEAHADSVAHELRAQGFSAETSGRSVTASA